MASLKRQTYTRRLPAGAEIFERDGQQFARWTNRRGQVRTARVTIPTTGKNFGKPRIIRESATVTAKYRDGAGRLQVVNTGCKTIEGARRKLMEFEARSERARSGLLSPAEERAAEHAAVPLVEHIAEYTRHMEARGVNATHLANIRRHLARLVADCRLTRLIDIDRTAIERWVDARATDEKPMSARVRNMHMSAITSFCNWCVRHGRLAYNPIARLQKADESSDRRRVRRAITESELGRLLRVASLRPVADYGRGVVKTGKEPTSAKCRKTWKRAELTWETIEEAHAAGRTVLLRKSPSCLAKLERRGREHALVYKTLFMTGLRCAELRAVRVADLEERDGITWVVLDGGRTKNGKRAEIPLRPDIAADLAAWLDERLAPLQAAAKAARQPIPMRLPGTELLLGVPTAIAKILTRDLKAANIAKRDDRGMVLDAHALRKSFGTHVLKAGVPLRVVMEAMRHSSPLLTAGVYTDVRLLDLPGAMNALPACSLNTSPAAKPQSGRRRR